MLKISKKADYAMIALKHLALHRQLGSSLSAGDIAGNYGISATLMAKVLQQLARGGLVAARHGAMGGYTLAKDPARISVLDAICAVEGPLSITSCVTHRGECGQAGTCTVREPLQRVNDTILGVLGRVTISQMAGDESRRLDCDESSRVVEIRL
jgi:FeS assembly SUF system regulator